MGKSVAPLVLILCFLAGCNKAAQTNPLVTRLAATVNEAIRSAQQLLFTKSLLITSLNNALESSTFKNVTLIISTLNATVKPYERAVSEVLLHVNNTAINNCVRRALTSIRQLVNAGSMTSYECALKIRVQLFNATSTVASYDIWDSSSLREEAFAAVSKCPDLLLIETSADYTNASVCYSEAMSKIRNYVSDTNAQLNTMRFRIGALQAQAINCISAQSKITAEGAQAAVNGINTCSEKTAISLLSADEILTFNASIKELKNYISSFEPKIRNSYDKVKLLSDLLRLLNSHLELEFQYVYQDISDRIEWYKFTAQNLGVYNYFTAEELQCMDDARQVFINHDYSHTIQCIADVANTFYSYGIRTSVIEARLKTLFPKAYFDSVFKCPFYSQRTEETATTCLDNIFSQLKKDTSLDLEDLIYTATFADGLQTKARACVNEEIIRFRKQGMAVVSVLNECLRNWMKKYGNKPIY